MNEAMLEKPRSLEVPITDLKLQYDMIKGEIDDAIGSVMESCSFILGPSVAAF